MTRETPRRDGDRFPTARHRDFDLSSLIGGGIEPGEEPVDAVIREVLEEPGAGIRVWESWAPMADGR
ncbi:MAG: NUDIX domain-containing protein [Protaetiibacter sp.]